MDVHHLISECVSEALYDVRKQDFSPLMGLFMNPADRKFIRRWNVYGENGLAVIELHCTLVGQGLMEYISEFVDKKGGTFRLFPDNGLICIEIKVKHPRKT